MAAVHQKPGIPMHKRVYGKRALKLPKLAAFDIETVGLGGDFILGAIVTSDGYRQLFQSLQAMFDFMLEHPQYRYLAHNASGYEFAYFITLIYDYYQSHEGVSIQPTLQGDSRIVQIRIYPDENDKKTCVDIRDTLCLFNMSLKKVADCYCPSLPKLSGNINFEKEVFNPGNALHVEYLWRDCDVIIAAYNKLFDQLVSLFGSPVAVTAGSTALKAFYTTIPTGHVYYRLKTEVEKFVRRAYYGGCVLPGHKVGKWGKVGSVDINGAYAYQMYEHEYPIGTPVLTAEFEENELGFYQVLATVPHDLFDRAGFNPVPMRTKSGLCWPSGTFETHLTTPEINFARELGCQFQILKGYVFYRREYVFRDFVEKCQEMELADGGIYKPTIKLLRNSCYGKFGTKAVHKELVFSKQTLLHEDGYMPLMDDSGTSLPTHIHGLYTKIGQETEADYILPHIAAYVTAYQRVYLMKHILTCYRAGAQNVYCDTDSIKCDYDVLVGLVASGYIPIGEKYGQFKTEEISEEFIVLGSKCFAGVTREGKEIIKAKGVPTRKLTIKAYTDALAQQYEKHAFDTLDSPLTLLKKRAIVKPIVRKRKITDIRNSFAWNIDSDGGIHPLIQMTSYEEILAQYRASCVQTHARSLPSSILQT